MKEERTIIINSKEAIAIEVTSPEENKKEQAKRAFNYQRLANKFVQSNEQN